MAARTLQDPGFLSCTPKLARPHELPTPSSSGKLSRSWVITFGGVGLVDVVHCKVDGVVQLGRLHLGREVSRWKRESGGKEMYMIHSGNSLVILILFHFQSVTHPITLPRSFSHFQSITLSYSFFHSPILTYIFTEFHN